MLEHWAPNPGMQNTTLLDGTSELDDAAMDNASSNEDQGRSSRKKNARNPTVNVWKKVCFLFVSLINITLTSLMLLY
eukprot:jgi/Phyca11/120286/e_gw1.41.381.1